MHQSVESKRYDAKVAAAALSGFDVEALEERKRLLAALESKADCERNEARQSHASETTQQVEAIAATVLSDAGRRFGLSLTMEPSESQERLLTEPGHLGGYWQAHPIPGHHDTLLPKWWRQPTQGTPIWDFCGRISVDGKPGLFVVEVKWIEDVGLEKQKRAVEREGQRAHTSGGQRRQRSSSIPQLWNMVHHWSRHLPSERKTWLETRCAYVKELASEGLPTVFLYFAMAKPADAKRRLRQEDKWWRSTSTKQRETLLVEGKCELPDGERIRLLFEPSKVDDEGGQEPEIMMLIGDR